MLKDLKKFVMRGNLVDLAIGFTVGAAFSTVAKSLVDDILMPPIGLLTGGADFADHFLLLSAGSEEAPPYATLADAQEAGAVTLNYGQFINNLIALMLVGLAMFLIIRMVNRVHDQMTEDEPAKDDKTSTEKKCMFCKSVIDFKAIRCPYCTSELSPPKAQPQSEKDEQLQGT